MMYICIRTKIAFQLRYFIDLAYKGTNFHGWQLQPNAETVQQHINKSFSTILRTTIEVVGAGRTDSGVHATQLFAHFDFDEKINIEETIYKVNAVLPDAIVVNSIAKVKGDAHARFDAVRRSYEYKIFLGRNPFFIETTWQLINKKLNVSEMNKACEILVTYTDFKCFSRSNTDVKTYNCDVFEAKWIQKDSFLVFHISANRFLRNMVRAIVGTLIDVGAGRTSLTQFEEIIKSKNRSNAGASAPAQGLFLTRVEYPKSIFINE